jgi:hypothetical protein
MAVNDQVKQDDGVKLPVEGPCKEGDMVLLPKWISKSQYGSLTFREERMPKCLKKYDGTPGAEIVKQNLLKVAQIVKKDNPRSLFDLNFSITGSIDDRDVLLEIMNNDLDKIDFIPYCIGIRLLELDSLNVYGGLAHIFWSPSFEEAKAYADTLVFNGTVVSRKVLFVAGSYLAMLELCKKDVLYLGFVFHKDIQKKILEEPIPTSNYLAWAINRALNDTEALENVGRLYPASYGLS